MPGVVQDTRRNRNSHSRGWIAILGATAAIWATNFPKQTWAQRPFPGSETSSSSPSTTSDSTPAWAQAGETKSSSATAASETLVKPAAAAVKAASSPAAPKQTASEAAETAARDATVTQNPAGKPKTLNNSVRNIAPGGNVKQTSYEDEQLLEKPLVDVIIEGNDTIRTDAIMRHLECRPGRHATKRMIQLDVTQLHSTRWFYNVNANFRASDEGPILVFRVVEKPILKSVTIRGNKKIKEGEISAHTGLTPGHAYDVAANRESVHRIKQLYHDKGFRFAEVTLTKGDAPEDREVIFDIVEGAKTKIWSINIEGSHDISESILKTKLSSKIVKLWIIQGEYDPDVISNDVLALKQYYMSLGYFDADVTSDVVLSEDKKKAHLTFKVDEGPRYKVDGIEVVGNEVISRESLLKELKLNSGDYFNERFLKQDVGAMTDQYDDKGRMFAKVIPTPRFHEGEDPVVDLVYQIDEDVPRYIGMINIHIRGDYPHSQELVVRQQVNRFLKPGHLARSSDFRMAQARVNGSGLWDKEEAPAFDMKPVAGDIYWPKIAERAQSRDELEPTSEVWGEFGSWERDEIWTSARPARVLEESSSPFSGISVEPSATGRSTIGSEPASSSEVLPDVPRRMTPTGPSAPPGIKRLPASGEESFPTGPSTSEHTTRRPAEEPDQTIIGAPTMADPEMVFRGQSEAAPIYRPQSIDAYGTEAPQDYLYGVSPQGDPFGDALSTPPPGFVDVNIDVTEGRTGRLMFGVGVNSDAGVVGSIVLQEDNFDLLRPPLSWSDIINGSAWRGAGQSFRLEAVPGTQVSRYMASWNDPYFMRTDFSLGVNGFYYNRYYQAWTEDRLGGRISVGRVLNKWWSATTALRLENVHMGDYPVGAPQSMLDVLGDNFLSTGSVGLTYDARDNSFMPTRGNYVNVSYEQAFGEFNYPRFDVSASQYFTVYERADGYGKHILSFTGQLGFTGSDTPVFEKYYAGGYSSFRGFYFRGVSPVQNGIKTGGDFMALGSVEYMVPLTASDNLRAVVFSDFGTVEENVTLKNFRASAGFGFRVTLPAMGPAPLAFDFAWPIVRDPTDQLRVFSFYVGFTR